MDLKAKIRDIPDFPKPGIIFKDITPLLLDPNVYDYIINQFVDHYRDQKIDKIVGIESRGFLFGTTLANRLGVGFALARKAGKLPYKTKSVTYDLEYGTDTLELHEDAILPNENVLIVDDLLATGGTAAAVAQLIESFDAKVTELAFVIDLAFLNGKEKLGSRNTFSLVEYN